MEAEEEFPQGTQDIKHRYGNIVSSLMEISCRMVQYEYIEYEVCQPRCDTRSYKPPSASLDAYANADRYGYVQ